MWRLDQSYLYPLPSQTFDGDRFWLSHIFHFIRRLHPKYRYTELGSYMGGTLTPALIDERCVDVLSIDLRPDLQADTRQTIFDYSQISTARMLDVLRTRPEFDLGKLTTFDGPADAYDFRERKSHFTFIDAEHTDEAVFADFLATYDQMERDGVCAFHDSNLITVGLQNICTFLNHQKRIFQFIVFKASSVAAIFFDDLPPQLPSHFPTNAQPWETYKQDSRDKLLLEAFKARYTVQYQLKDRPVKQM